MATTAVTDSEDITDEEMERLVNMDYDDFHDEDGNTIEG